MDFESHTFGVKIAETNISLELIESLDELSKYQFMLSDKISYSYNANTTYKIDIQQLTTQEYIEFFGWKLISLSFPGNWYGQWGVWELEDLNGKRKSVHTTKQAWYCKNSKIMIKESIEKAKEFAENNYSVDYHNFLSDTSLKANLPFLPESNKISLDTFACLISLTKQYIEDYKKVISSLSDKKDERCLLLTDKLKKHFSDILKEYYPFEIKDLCESK